LFVSMRIICACLQATSPSMIGKLRVGEEPAVEIQAEDPDSRHLTSKMKTTSQATEAQAREQSDLTDRRIWRKSRK